MIIFMETERKTDGEECGSGNGSGPETSLSEEIIEELTREYEDVLKWLENK